jgi:hypothetical protein
MHAFLVSLAIFGQTDSVVPPAPTPISPGANSVVPDPSAPSPATSAVPSTAAPAETFDEMKTWLLTRLIVDLNFDAQKAAEVEGLINTLNEQQLRVLIGVYKERSAKRDQVSKSQREANQQQTLDQAKLNLQQAEAYRDHLKREHDYRILQGVMTQNLVYQNIVNNQRLMYLNGGPYTYGAFGYSPYGYGGFGYGPIGYGGYGYGPATYGTYYYQGPAMGSSVFYANPYSYGGGMGFW